MDNSLMEDTITVIDQMMGEHPDLQQPLEMHKLIFLAQKELRKSRKKGTSLTWNKSVINELQQKASSSNQPIVHFLSPSMFDPVALLHTCEKVTDILIERGASEQLKEFTNGVESGRVNILGAVGATLNGDGKLFENYGEMFKADPALILFIISSSLQPCIEEIANNVDSSFLDKWWQISCPVCGRTTKIARLKSRKRHLACTFCGAVYIADEYLCTNCGNKDPGTLKFLVPEEHPGFRIDFCEKCRHYLKIIDETRLRKPVLKGLEDIITINLDLIAKDAGLVRE